MRTTRTMIEFAEPFLLSGLTERQPAGSYCVDVDEEEIDGLTFVAHRRVGARLYMPAGSNAGDCRFAVPISLAELDAAISHQDLTPPG